MATEEQIREQLGREVRAVWMAWAREQPDPKPSWLLPWEELTEPEREVDRRIGHQLYAQGYAAGLLRWRRATDGDLRRRARDLS
jgi:hypothetical protein